MSAVETGVSSDTSISIEMDGDKPVTRSPEGGIAATPEQNLIEFTEGGEGGDSDDLELEGTEGGDDEGETESGDAPDDLGDFDPEDAERWDAQYKGEDGKLNQDALSREFWANANDDSPGSLNEGTYAYLESLGISQAMAKDVEAALVTQKNAAENKSLNRDGELFALAGTLSGDAQNGDKVLAEALKWGKGGGYSKAQQKRFNDILKGSDQDARLEATELLLNRYLSAEGKSTKPAKPKLPGRDATNGRGVPSGSGLKPFASREEARAARKAAGNNTEARQLVAKRLALGIKGE